MLHPLGFPLCRFSVWSLVGQDSIQHTYSLTVLGEPSKTLHLQNLDLHPYFVALAQPCFSLIVLENTITSRRENQKFPILHDEDPTWEITYPTVPANKMPGINISPSWKQIQIPLLNLQFQTNRKRLKWSREANNELQQHEQAHCWGA